MSQSRWGLQVKPFCAIVASCCRLMVPSWAMALPSSSLPCFYFSFILACFCSRTFSERIKHAPIWGPQFRVTFCPLFRGGGKQRIHAGDAVETIGIARETGVFRYRKTANSPSGKEGRRRHKTVTTIWCMFDSPWNSLVDLRDCLLSPKDFEGLEGRITPYFLFAFPPKKVRKGRLGMYSVRR